MTKYQRGQSIAEIVVALAIFLVVVGGGVISVVGSLNAGRLGGEETRATSLAVEGLEATDSIRDQSWDNLAVGNYGVTKTGNVWQFNGTSDFDPSSRFERTVSLAEVQRDTNGDIVTTGGTPDPDTFYVSSNVAWDFQVARTNSVTVGKYITNWQENVGGEAVGTPSPSPTPGGSTPTPTPTSTPAIASCPQYCTSIGYSNGTCRKKPPDCTANGQVAEGGGDAWCTQGGNTKCCCTP